MIYSKRTKDNLWGDTMNGVEKIIKDVTLTYEQKVLSLARYAENSVRVLNISEDTEKLREEAIICDLF